MRQGITSRRFVSSVLEYETLVELKEDEEVIDVARKL